MKLTPVIEKFILHWGEMGARWGINRTVAQIHALLFVSPQPLHAEEIVETLGVARSNVSNSLRELQSWGIVKIVHVMGDRRDHFESMKDVWAMFQVIAHERKRREIDPTLQVLRECVSEAGPKEEAHTREQLRDLRDFLESFHTLYEQNRNLPTPALQKLVKLGGQLGDLLGLGR